MAERPSIQELRDYVDYVEDKISMGELPFTFLQWQTANIECAIEDLPAGDYETI